MKKILDKFNLGKKSLFFFLFLIILLATFARFYKLDSVPLGFHIDEAAIADNANFILHTGRDTNNNFLPLQTEQFGDYNPMGYTYLAVMAVKILGPTIFAARSVGALFNVLAVLGVFLFAYSIFEKKGLSLLASLFFALSPWDIVLSRSTEETAASLVFIIFGFALLIWSVKKEKIHYLLLATVLLFTSYFMYFTPRLFVPLLFLAFFIPLKYWYSKRKALFTKAFIGCFILIGAAAFILVFGIHGGNSRFNQVSIFGFPETKLVMEERIREDGTQHISIPITRLFHNKPFDYSLTFINNYFEYFSGSFLFTKGGLPIWFNVPGMGLVYLIELPFIIYGLYWLFRERKPWSFLIVVWLLLGPVVASLTVDDIPNVRRALVMVPVIEILAAYGVLSVLRHTPKKLRVIGAGIFVVLFTFNSLYFFHQFFIHAPIHQNWSRNEGFGEMVATIKKDYANYNKVIVTKSEGGIYPLILFYMNYDPATYLKEESPKDKENGGFGKFFFANASCPSIDKDPKFPKVSKIIYVDNGTCPDYPDLRHMQHVANINRKDGTRVFRIVYE